MSKKLDCIVVGYSDRDFQSYAVAQKRMRKVSGAFEDVKHNSVLLHGKRLSYMDLINHGMEQATGANPRLSLFEVPSLGVTYLTSFLRRRSLQVEMVGFFNYEREKLTDLLAESPLAVAITTTYYVDTSPIVEVAQFVREHGRDTKIIVGGPYINAVSTYPKETQKYLYEAMGADIYICDSQGEQTLADTLATLRDGDVSDLGKVPNLVFRSDKHTYSYTDRQPENNDLDENVVDFSLFSENEGVFDHPVFLRTARSCPFTCSFCSFPAVAGKHIVSDIDVVERQLKFLHERGVRDLIFIDDTFNVPLPRFKNLLRMMIKNRFEFNWISFFRCSNADDTAFDLMRESGCKQVFLGIESGDQKILNNMQKFADVDKYKEGIRKLNERDIVTYASIITGFPGETKESVENTIRFIEESEPTFFNLQLYYHDPRTPIQQEAKKYGLEGSGYSWRHNTMSWQEAAAWTEHGFRTISNSLATTLYGFSIWALPYLISRGLSLHQIKSFAAVAHEMLVEGFNDEMRDLSRQEARLVEVFRGSDAS